MKKTLSFLLLVFISLASIAQNPALKVQKYVLDNGFTVFLNEDKNAREAYGAVVVKAGSKNDPSDATGMAHYLEHLLFKGTTELGTTDHAKEKPYIDSIITYYDMLGKTKDELERKRIQQLINNQSVLASAYALPTEFDKLVKSIGGTNLNAFTTEEMTVYHNAFPGEQIEKWLDLYSHRFQNPVFRSFQSELEVVYEEKNRGMDNFQTKLFEEMNKNLFKHHPYGTQTTIGTVEHLKNPSLTKMYNYFNTNYVAGNMALVLCGNFDAAKALPIIKEKFGKLKPGTLRKFPNYPETVFKGKEVVEVNYTPIKVTLLGYKTVPSVHADKAALEVFLSLLYNESETGKLNKLQRNGEFMFAGGFNYTFNDDGAIIFFIVPKLLGQSFDEAEKLLFDEMTKIKNGELSEKDLQIIKTELYRQKQEELESSESRAFNIVNAFNEGITWEEYLEYNKKLKNVTREDVMRVAKQYFGDNYFALHSTTGFPKKEVLEKPGFKPVVTDQKAESAYAQKFNSTPVSASTPKFLDMEKDATLLTLNESNKLYVTTNPVNDVFSLDIEFKVGNDSLKNLDLASGLFSYFNTNGLTTDQLKEEFALLGMTYYAYADDDRFTISFIGLDTNLEASLKLINRLLNEAAVEEKAITTLQNDVISERKFSEKEPDVLGDALFEYVKLGKKSAYINRLSGKELKKLKAADLLTLYKKAITFNAVWHYAGTAPASKVQQLMAANITLANNKKEYPLTVKRNNTSAATVIYLVNDKKAVQSQVNFLVNSGNYTSTPELDASITAFNNYMGGDFSGLILQEIREFRSLAYSAYGRYARPGLQNNPAWFQSFVGCQADKTNEAITVMMDLLRNMPQKPERMEPLRLLLQNSASAHYPELREISYTIENLRQRGYTTLPFKSEYPQYSSLTFEDVVKFYDDNLKNKPVIITIYGNKSKMDMDALAKLGKVVELKRKDILRE